LRRAGFDAGYLDGRFGETLKQCLMEFQHYFGLPVTGTAKSNELYALGLR